MRAFSSIHFLRFICINNVVFFCSCFRICSTAEEGQRLLRDMHFSEQTRFFQAVFEIGRRYKILNPERMRSAYGKLIYFLMDSTKPDIQQLLQFDLVTPGAHTAETVKSKPS